VRPVAGQARGTEALSTLSSAVDGFRPSSLQLSAPRAVGGGGIQLQVVAGSEQRRSLENCGGLDCIWRPPHAP
jgi:hypothetical protein